MSEIARTALAGAAWPKQPFPPDLGQSLEQHDTAPHQGSAAALPSPTSGSSSEAAGIPLPATNGRGATAGSCSSAPASPCLTGNLAGRIANGEAVRIRSFQLHSLSPVIDDIEAGRRIVAATYKRGSQLFTFRWKARGDQHWRVDLRHVVEPMPFVFCEIKIADNLKSHQMTAPLHPRLRVGGIVERSQRVAFKRRDDPAGVIRPGAMPEPFRPGALAAERRAGSDDAEFGRADGRSGHNTGKSDHSAPIS
jgi:hypothetical protein